MQYSVITVQNPYWTLWSTRRNRIGGGTVGHKRVYDEQGVTLVLVAIFLTSWMIRSSSQMAVGHRRPFECHLSSSLCKDHLTSIYTQFNYTFSNVLSRLLSPAQWPDDMVSTAVAAFTMPCCSESSRIYDVPFLQSRSRETVACKNWSPFPLHIFRFDKL